MKYEIRTLYRGVRLVEVVLIETSEALTRRWALKIDACDRTANLAMSNGWLHKGVSAGETARFLKQDGVPEAIADKFVEIK